MGRTSAQALYFIPLPVPAVHSFSLSPILLYSSLLHRHCHEPLKLRLSAAYRPTRQIGSSRDTARKPIGSSIFWISLTCLRSTGLYRPRDHLLLWRSRRRQDTHPFLALGRHQLLRRPQRHRPQHLFSAEGSNCSGGHGPLSRGTVLCRGGTNCSGGPGPLSRGTVFSGDGTIKHGCKSSKTH